MKALRMSTSRGSGLLAGSAVAVLLLATGCGGSAKSGGSASSSTPAGSATAGGSSAAATVQAHSGPLGSYLTDGTGRALYLFVSDTAGKSSCSAACAKYWPPLSSAGTPTGSGGVSDSMLATITRDDGSRQVSYAGHPLYYYAQDSAAGDTLGQGSDGFGAKWWLVAPSGQAISSPASAAPSTSSGGYSGGGGY